MAPWCLFVSQTLVHLCCLIWFQDFRCGITGKLASHSQIISSCICYPQSNPWDWVTSKWWIFCLYWLHESQRQLFTWNSLWNVQLVKGFAFFCQWNHSYRNTYCHFLLCGFSDQQGSSMEEGKIHQWGELQPTKQTMWQNP